jgi:hypothetical protein
MAFESWSHYLGPARVVEYTTHRLFYLDFSSQRFQKTEVFKAYMFPIEQARLLEEITICTILPTVSQCIISYADRHDGLPNS